MTTYKIATLGTMLVATASTDELLRERVESAISEANLDFTFDDLTIEDGLTLYPTRAAAEAAEESGVEMVYWGTSEGWLEDDDGRMEYFAAGRA